MTGEQPTLAELHAAARARGLRGYRSMRRADLEAALGLPASPPASTPAPAPDPPAAPAAAAAPVRLERSGPLALIVIDDPEVRNALGTAAFAALGTILDELEAAPDVRVVAVTGSGSVFCSGARIGDYDGRDDGGAELTRTGTAALDRLAALPVPVVALLNGHAVGGGAEVALACDLRLATHDAELRLIHTGIGLVPGWGGIERLSRIVGEAAAFRLLALRARLRAEQAQRLGLVDDVVPAGGLRDRARALAEHVAEGDRDAIARVKRILQAPREARAALATAAFVESWPARRLEPRR